MEAPGEEVPMKQEGAEGEEEEEAKGVEAAVVTKEDQAMELEAISQVFLSTIPHRQKFRNHSCLTSFRQENMA